MIGLIDYGMGNLPSVSKALINNGCQVIISNQPEDLKKATGLILPGVGAFGEAAANLKLNGMDQLVKEHIKADKPFLGICLGLQLLFSASAESPESHGLGVLPGKVVKFSNDMHDNSGNRLKVPHMGWNSVHFKNQSSFTNGIADNSYFYFVHSYYVITDEEYIAGTTEYGSFITVAVQHNNLFACQFHPEKSQKAGLKIIQNFGVICENYTGN